MSVVLSTLAAAGPQAARAKPFLLAVLATCTPARHYKTTALKPELVRVTQVPRDAGCAVLNFFTLLSTQFLFCLLGRRFRKLNILEVLTAVTVNTSLFWVVASCRLV
jgi:hypothetical protein